MRKVEKNQYQLHLDCLFGIVKFADEKKYAVDAWIEETVSSIKKIEDRKVGKKTECLTP